MANFEFTTDELYELIVGFSKGWQRDRDELEHLKRQVNFLQQQLDEKIND